MVTLLQEGYSLWQQFHRRGTHCGNSSTGGVLTVATVLQDGVLTMVNSSTGWGTHCGNSSTGWGTHCG